MICTRRPCNGTYTTYQYDPNGNVLHLINYAPSGSVNNRFDYTYDALGRRTTMATMDGKWMYSYDGTGQLTHAVFASTNPNVPSQDLVYNYDAVGNRASTVINGVTTTYVANNLNQYTAVGGASPTYDANGNELDNGTYKVKCNYKNLVCEVRLSSNNNLVATYKYDSAGRVVLEAEPSAVTGYNDSYNDLLNGSGLRDKIYGSGSLRPSWPSASPWQ